MRRQLLFVSVLTGLSQLAAVFKLWFTAQVFGVGSELDGYNLALVLPTLISGVLAGVLQTGLFPVRARWAAQDTQDKRDDSVEAFERSVLLGCCAIGLIIATLLAISVEHWGALLASSSPASVKSALRQAAIFTAWLVVLNLAGDCAGYLLAMRNRFAIAAGAPIANGLFGGFLLGVWPEGGLLNLVIGTVLGLALQVSICVVGLKTLGFEFLGKWPDKNRLRASWRDMSTLGIWIIPGVVFSNLVASLPPVLVASHGEGAVSAFGYAYRLHSSALQLLVMAGSTLILARFSELVVRGDTSAIRNILVKVALASAFIGSVGVVLVWALGAPVLEWVFGGRFDADAAQRVSQHWWWMSLGLGFAILGNVFAKLWQAQGRPRLISTVAGLSLLTLGVSYYLLDTFLQEYALAACISISAMAVVFFGLCFTNLPKSSL